MSRRLVFLLSLLLSFASESLIAKSGHADCASQPLWIATSKGDYCGAQDPASEFATAKRSTTTESRSLRRRGGAEKKQAGPAVPITPFLPNGPPDLSAADFRLDQRLSTMAARMMARQGNTEIRDSEIGELKDLGNNVFHRLISAGFGQPYPWKLTLVNCAARNAFSTPYGQVYVCRGLLNEIGDNPGLWAAVLAHEVAHSGLRHGVMDYLIRQRMRSAMARYGAGRPAPGYGANNQRGRWRGDGSTPSDTVRRMRLSLEIRADQVGMLVMARAGYHPDYVFALRQMLENQPGERARPVVPLSDHPSWELEQPQLESQYANAMAEFHKYWPNAAQSPVGFPPTVVSFGAIFASEDEATHSTVVSVPVWCRNSATQIKLEVNFQPATGEAHDPATDRGLNLTTMAPCSDQSANMRVKFRIPAEASTSEGAELSAVVAAYADDSHFLGATRAFNVNSAESSSVRKNMPSDVPQKEMNTHGISR